MIFSGTCKLYQYYDGMVQTDDQSNIKTQQVSSFVDLKSALKTFFWALFCMTPMESADVIIENIRNEPDYKSVINHHTFTEIIGYISLSGNISMELSRIFRPAENSVRPNCSLKINYRANRVSIILSTILKCSTHEKKINGFNIEMLGLLEYFVFYFYILFGPF